MRKTKIIATIGPASREPEVLDQLIAAGMDCARLNFSYGTLEEHAEVIHSVRQLSAKQGKRVAILQDLEGIKLRLGHLDEQVQLNHGDEVTLGPEERSTGQGRLPFPQPAILKNLRPVTGLSVNDFHLLVRLKIFNTEQMNQAVFAFRRYEDASLRYTGIDSHEALTHIGLYDTVVARE